MQIGIGYLEIPMKLTSRETRKVKHEWLKERTIDGAWLVLRIDDYNTDPASRGQFYPVVQRSDDANKAVWGSEGDAMAAAAWATKQFGHQYGVFKMIAVVERTIAPVMVSKV